MRKALVLALFLAPIFALPAAADPLKAENAQDVRVPMAAKMQRALGVRATTEKDGWRLQLRAPIEGTAEVFDVTPGSPAVTFTLRLVAGMISFDIGRFAGGHTYHVAVRSGQSTSSSLVYLYPDASAAKQQQARRGQTGATRVRFEANEPAPEGSDEIAPEKKGSL